jgi:RNA polymerase sigma-70 factor (ECF subfamily)
MVIGYESKRVLKKREERFLSLISDNNDKLYKIAYSYVKNKDDALDIVQEAVYKGYISYHKVKKPEFEKTWLTRIVINTAIDFIRKNKKIVSIDMSFIENIADSGVNHLDDKLAVEHALENLNERERTVIILRYFEDMKLDEIAEILETPISTIKSILYRSLKKMEVDLKEADVDE